jgi:hypothetical protein
VTDLSVDDDGVAYRRASLSVTLGREILLEWAVLYASPIAERGPAASSVVDLDYTPIFRVESRAGSSPSPKYAARRLRELRS